MYKFIKQNQFKFINFDIKGYDEEGQKIYPDAKEIPFAWQNKTFEELDKLYNKSKTPKKLYLIRATGHLIFDTDEEIAYEKLTKILKELNLYNKDSITLSTSGDKHYYKRHFWFKIEDEQFKNMRKQELNKEKKDEKLEIFINGTSGLAERAETELKNISVLTFKDYKKIVNIYCDDLSDDDNYDYEEKEDEKEEEEVKKPVKKIKPVSNNEDNLELIKILDNLKNIRFENYDYWLILYFIFVNEGYDLEIFDLYSKKRGGKKYDKQKNDSILKNIKPKKGYTIATLYLWLKEDNLNAFKEIQLERTDLIKIFSNPENNYELGNLYYNYNPNKYVRSEITGIWYEYNNNNILILRGKNEPSSLHNSITETYLKIVKEQLILLLKKKDKLTEEDQKKEKILNTFKDKYAGKSQVINNIKKYLPHLYNVENIDDKLDSNVNLFAFNNMLYDNSIKSFREIIPYDFITKTTKYDINLKSNKEIRTKIINLIKSMFETEEMYIYHLRTIALSMFGNHNESFYINSGSGRNGKGLCSQLVEKSFGSYFYQGESTFYTTVYRSDRPNPTLYNLKGVRYFLTTEPEANEDTKFNIGMVKSTTGRDTITTRDLNKSNISYTPQFTPFMQCNKKPKIDKIDNAIKGRFKIINFPFSFVDNPEKPNEKMIDTTLKSSINEEWYNEFMLLLLETNEKMPKKIDIPKEVENNINEYLNEVNIIKDWLIDTFEFTGEFKKKTSDFRSKELLELYNNSGRQHLTPQKFNNFIKMIDEIKKVTYGGSDYYRGLKFKQVNDDEI